MVPHYCTTRGIHTASCTRRRSHRIMWLYSGNRRPQTSPFVGFRIQGKTNFRGSLVLKRVRARVRPGARVGVLLCEGKGKGDRSLRRKSGRGRLASGFDGRAELRPPLPSLPGLGATPPPPACSAPRRPPCPPAPPSASRSPPARPAGWPRTSRLPPEPGAGQVGGLHASGAGGHLSREPGALLLSGDSTAPPRETDTQRNDFNGDKVTRITLTAGAGAATAKTIPTITTTTTTTTAANVISPPLIRNPP